MKVHQRGKKIEKYVKEKLLKVFSNEIADIKTEPKMKELNHVPDTYHAERWYQDIRRN